MRLETINRNVEYCERKQCKALNWSVNGRSGYHENDDNAEGDRYNEVDSVRPVELGLSPTQDDQS